MPAAERLKIILGGRIRLIAFAVTDHLARVVAIDDAGRRVGNGLLVSSVEVGREKNLIEPEARINIEVGRQYPVPQDLKDIEHILLVRRGILDSDRSGI